MSNEKKKNKKGLVALIIIVVIAVVIGGFFVLENKGIIKIGRKAKVLNETITAENFDELTKSIAEELGKSDELYYFAYAGMYYMMTDGMSSAFSGNEDENAMYVNIYGKTAENLIEEGRQLMEENNVSLDEFKENIENLSNTNSTYE